MILHSKLLSFSSYLWHNTLGISAYIIISIKCDYCRNRKFSWIFYCLLFIFPSILNWPEISALSLTSAIFVRRVSKMCLSMTFEHWQYIIINHSFSLKEFWCFLMEFFCEYVLELYMNSSNILFFSSKNIFRELWWCRTNANVIHKILDHIGSKKTNMLLLLIFYFLWIRQNLLMIHQFSEL